MKVILEVIIRSFGELFLIPYIMIFAIYYRFKERKINIGMGPEPLINNVYHKRALELYGYKVQTFVVKPYYISKDFDIILSKFYNFNSYIGKIFIQLALIRIAFKYEGLYIYFNGGPLGFTIWLWKIEPFFYKISGVKTVVMPYGADVQEMSRSNNLYFKHTFGKDYPKHRFKRNKIKKKIDLWTKYADHIISGCEWVDYMYYWDTLMLAHFSIDVKRFNIQISSKTNEIFKILHAPNHKNLKGTSHLRKIVKLLKAKGYKIELILLEGVSNKKIIDFIQEVDLIADQFIIGWYAMFAIEAMVNEKPVLCYLRDDLIDLYEKSELIEKNEIPIINTSVSEIENKIIWAYNNRDELKKIGKRSREYVMKHHSIEYVGNIFDKINKKLSIG